MSDSKQCTDKANTGLGVAVTKLTPSDPKGPALKGAVEQTGVPTNKQVRS